MLNRDWDLNVRMTMSNLDRKRLGLTKRDIVTWQVGSKIEPTCTLSPQQAFWKILISLLGIFKYKSKDILRTCPWFYVLVSIVYQV